MNRRSLLKGLISLPLLRHLDLNLSTTPVAEAEVEAEAPENRWATVAASGLCAPMSPIYDFCLQDDRRPVRDSLPVFKASRGEIRYIPYNSVP